MAKAFNVSRETLLETLAFVVTAFTLFSKWTKTTVDDAVARVIEQVASNELLRELIFQILGYNEAWETVPDTLPPIAADNDGVLQLDLPGPEDVRLSLIQQTPLDSRVEQLITPQHVQALTAAGISVDVFKAVLPILVELLRKRLSK